MVEGVKDYAIFMLSPFGLIESSNQGAKELQGYAENEILGKHFSIFYPEAAKATNYPEYELEQAQKHGRFEDEGWRIRKDGSPFFANVIITALYNEQGELLGFSKITRDLTEKREAEERLRKSEERYRMLVEGVKDYAIFLLDPQGHIASWNQGAKRLKGYEESEIIGKHFSIFYTPQKVEERYPEYELEQVLKYGKFEDEGLRVKKDGSTFYASVVITALYGANKELIGFSKITRDLTERKQAEENLRLLNVRLETRVRERTEELSQKVKELKTINADLDNFIYTASHDLKAPLTNIQGLIDALSDTLRAKQGIDEEMEGLLDMINLSIQRFMNTVRDLAAVNASQRIGKEDVIPVDLSVLLEDVTLSIDHLVKESNAQFHLDVAHDFALRFSKIHIRSILFNLLSNAIKYRSPQRALVVYIKAYKEGSFYCIEVKDNGMGFREENKEKVFQLFQRLHSHVDGSGIGLYIIKKIVDNVGGHINVSSAVDGGATFTICLPDTEQ